MTTELEETLARELQGVADGLQVPPMPSVAPAEGRRPGGPRWWQPTLAAAAVLLVLGLIAVLLGRQGDREPQPTQSPSPSVPRSPQDAAIADAAPTVPYVLDRRLHVDGTVVPGDWGSVESRGGVWLAQQVDGGWWWGGPGVDPARIDAQLDQAPAISPNGRYIAFVDTSGGTAHPTGFDTQPAGEGFGDAPVELPATEDGVASSVRAVTDDGDVFVQGTRTSLMWRAQYQDQRTVVDLSASAPDQVVLQGTAAGLVVVDGADGAVDATGTEPYLATISPAGALDEVAPLPTYDALDVNPAGTWLVRAPAGTLAGEVPGVAGLRAQPIGDGDEKVLDAPDGWVFANGSWVWEDDEDLVAVLLPDDAPAGADARLARCDVSLGACRTIPTPGGDQESSGEAGPTGTPDGSAEVTPDGTAEGALEAVVRAVVADDRTLLVDGAVVGDAEWQQLRTFAADGSGSAGTCRDNGEGTKDCEIAFDAAPSTVYYAILEPAENAYGWRITYVSIGGA